MLLNKLISVLFNSYTSLTTLHPSARLKIHIVLMTEKSRPQEPHSPIRK
uniref:Uncharacterized protein n=1 Tax=Siphoviridae sp. ctuUw41 TaxID=2826503 RepID=A0A8S5MYN3_9CAUD|nr:MAG TPA: hypothetical protein [Siphoviridae sp. ctuUw41]